MEPPGQIQSTEELVDLISEWNANRLDLFEITKPDENLEYHGVMRFLFQDAGAKLATKCIRVSSMQNTANVIETLVEKFRPDMKMLTTPIYYLYEVNSNGDERRMNNDEYPLETQLLWTRDEREGQFILRNAAHKPLPVKTGKEETSFKRSRSKREVKKDKKKAKDDGSKKDDEEPSGVFVRTKSNSEAVMKRRRELKVQKKLEEIQKEGDQGGLLKVHGDSLNVDVPYKSLLLSVTDTAAFVVQEMLDKYGLAHANPADYCLVQVFNAHAGEIGGGLRPQENTLKDDECPLAILQLQVNKGNITFHVRRRDGKRTVPADTPFLLELNLDGSDMPSAKRHPLLINMTEVGSIASPSSGQHLRLIGPTILSHHAVIANIEGIVTITPTTPEAECYVEGSRIYETTVLQNGRVVRFGHHHAFRFFDPKVERDMRKMSGGVPTMSIGGPKGPPSVENGPPGYSPKLDDVLPAGLEFRDEGEDNFIHAVVSDVAEGMCQFKLAPCYTLYLAARYRVDRVRPGAPPEEHFQRISVFARTISLTIRDVMARSRTTPQELAFWLANMSELLHFYKMDRDLMKHTTEAQEILADTVQEAFKDLVYVMQGDLYQSMPSFLSDTDNDQEAGEVLHVLSSAMSLLRRCRVNAALTIQLFSQLFHFINMWLFNKLVMEPQLGLTTRQWGERLKRRLARIEAWAEKQGLELAADCHLCRITQAAHLLQAPKHSPEDIASISSSCFKLNSLQLKALLEQYKPDNGERPHVPQDLIDSVVSVARNTADDLTRSEGRDVKLEEDADLQLPFLLPEDGYSCDIIKGIPQGLQEFLEPVMADGLCRLTPLPSASGSWIIFMPDHEDYQGESAEEMAKPLPEIPDGPQQLPQDPEIIQIQLHKVNGSMGLSIVAAKGESQPDKGIYIKSVVNGGAAALDGRLQAGDQLLEVDNKTLVGLSQERAAELMKETGQIVSLRVAKQGAIYHGLATLIQQPTPPLGRAPLSLTHDNPSYTMSQSKSTPLLNNNGYGKPPQFAGQPPVDDFRSRSQGNLKAPIVDINRWPNAAPAPDNRVMSQPNVGQADSYNDHSPNYQNYPSDLRPGGPQMQGDNVAKRHQPAQRPHSQYRESTGGPVGQRPRSEFVDANWYPPTPNDYGRQQPIYQNQPPSKPSPPGQKPKTQDILSLQNQGYEDRELPSPPGQHGLIQPPHPADDELPLPPPPSNDYVNYSLDNSRYHMDPNRNRFDPLRQEQPRPSFDPRAQEPRTAEPPPWARSGPRGGAPIQQQRYPGPRPAGPPVQRPNGPQHLRPNGALISGPRSPNSPPGQGNMRGGYIPPTSGIQPDGSFRAPQPGDAIRAAQVDLHRPQDSRGSDSYREPYRGAELVRGPQPGDAFRGQQGPRPVRQPMPSQQMRPGATYGQQMGPGPVRPQQMNNRPPVNQQMIQNQLNYVSTNPWQKESHNQRLAEERRLQRENVIHDLESKPYKTQDEEERLSRLKLDSEFEKRAEQAKNEQADRGSDEEDNRAPMMHSMRNGGQRPLHQQSGPPQHQPQYSRQLQPSQQKHSPTEIPTSVKRDMLQSKTVTFKPAYRDDTLRPGEYPKPVIKPGVPDDRINQMNRGSMPRDQQDLLKQQRQHYIDYDFRRKMWPSISDIDDYWPQEDASGPYALSTPEKEALRNRLEEELREKQRREAEDQRRALEAREDEEMKRRREHDLIQRREAERHQMQQLDDAKEEQQRYMRDAQQQQRDFPPPPERSSSYNPRFSTGPYEPPMRATPSSPANIDRKSVSFRGGMENDRPSSQYTSQPLPYQQSTQQYQPVAAPNQTAPTNAYPSNAYQTSAPNINYQNYPGGSPPHTSKNQEMVASATPGVIGAQEVYRDPRQRIEAVNRAQKNRGDSDRMSFKDKMKMFATEAGESSPVERAKSSKTQRALESTLVYGQ